MDGQETNSRFLTKEEILKNMQEQGLASTSVPSASGAFSPSGSALPSGGTGYFSKEDILQNMREQQQAAAEAERNRKPGIGEPAFVNPDRAKPESGVDYSKMSAEEAFGRGVQALPESLAKTGGQLFEAVTHPVETLGALAELGKGAFSAGAGYFVDQPDKEQKAKDERVFNAVAKRYIDTYGDLFSGAAGLKKEWSEDPVSLLMDASMLAPPVGMTGRALGLGKAATAAQKAISLLDPSQLALSTAGKLTDLGGYLSKTVLGGTSGVGKEALDLVENIARKGDKGAQAAFLQSAWSRDKDAVINSLPDELDTAFANLGKMKNAEFAASKSKLVTQNLPTAPISDAFSKVAKEIGLFADPKTGRWSSLDFPREAAALEQMWNRFSTRGDFSAVSLHNMKVGFNDLINTMKSSGATSKIGAMAEIPDAVKNVIVKADKSYADMMDFWQEWRDVAKEMKSALGANSRVAASAKLVKMMKSVQSGKNKKLFDMLRQVPGGEYLPERLAGALVREFMPNWMNKIQNLSLTSLAGSQFGLGIPHAIAASASFSPRLVGNLVYGYGGVRRAGELAQNLLRAPVSPAISQIGGMMEPVEQQTASGSYFAGGRIARQSGGRVGSPGSAADKLIAAAEKAKNRHSDDTSPLLDVPDEAITKALAIANEKI